MLAVAARTVAGAPQRGPNGLPPTLSTESFIAPSSRDSAATTASDASAWSLSGKLPSVFVRECETDATLIRSEGEAHLVREDVLIDIFREHFKPGAGHRPDLVFLPIVCLPITYLLLYQYITHMGRAADCGRG